MKEVITPELTRYQETKLRMYQNANQNESLGGLVLTGDSLIDFFPAKDLLSSSLSIRNRGIAGTDTEWLSQHMVKQVLACQPDKLFLLIGTNDIGLGRSHQTILANYQKLLELIAKESSLAPYVLSLLPVNEASKYRDRVKIRTNTAIKTLNQSLKALVGDQFIDAYHHFLDDKDQLAEVLTTDGLHLTPDGYAVLAKILQPYS